MVSSFTKILITQTSLFNYAAPHLNEGHPGALDGHHAHRLAELQVQNEDLSGIKQQHVVPLGWQVGQLETVVQRHRLRAEGAARTARTGTHPENKRETNFSVQLVSLRKLWS